MDKDIEGHLCWNCTHWEDHTYAFGDNEETGDCLVHQKITDQFYTCPQWEEITYGDYHVYD